VKNVKKSLEWILVTPENRGLPVRLHGALPTEHTSFKLEIAWQRNYCWMYTGRGFITMHLFLVKVNWRAVRQEREIRWRTDLKSGNTHGSFVISISQEGLDRGRNASISHLFKTNTKGSQEVIRYLSMGYGHCLVGSSILASVKVYPKGYSEILRGPS